MYNLWQESQILFLFEGWKGNGFGRVHVVRTGFSGVSRWSAGERRLWRGEACRIHGRHATVRQEGHLISRTLGVQWEAVIKYQW
jgi:hypothetical protein